MLKLADWRHSLRLSWRRSEAPKLQRPWKKKHAAVIFRKNFGYIFCSKTFFSKPTGSLLSLAMGLPEFVCKRSSGKALNTRTFFL
jgi:hypothetical protein